MIEEQTPVIQTFELTKEYAHKVVLDKVSITVHKGDIYGFVGRNGAGKTTLIRVLCNLAFPTSGSYALNGITDIQELRDMMNKVASMVETPALYPDMSGEDNLRARCYLFGVKPTPELIEQRLIEVGLEQVIGTKKKTKDYSLGMKQRLGIAMALMGEPEILLLDEPTNGLDPDGIKEVRDLLIKINQERGVTILISSHILGELSKMATRFGFIEQGKIIKEISAEDLRKQEGRSLRILSKDIDKIKKSLKKHYPEIEYDTDADGVTIYHVQNSYELVSILQKDKIKIIDFSTSENNLEEFFLSLLGGENNG